MSITSACTLSVAGTTSGRTADWPAPTPPTEDGRLPTYGGLWAWDFERDGRELKARVDGQLTFNSIFHVRDAVLEGYGLAYIPEDLARPYLSKGQLAWVLQEWSPPWPGYHLYYPSRRQSSPAFALIVDALRHRKK